jgi:radical SAM superfamily enzyme YgiQ (UPF0313 family)
LGIASYLEEQGIGADVVDYNVEKPQVDFGAYDLVGLSVHCGNVVRTLQRAQEIKEAVPDLPLVVGGPQATANPGLFASKPYFDAVVGGEGEKTTLEYLQASDKSKIKGLWLATGKEPFFTGERPWIADLDALPFPALEKVDLAKYDVLLKLKRPISNIMTSRGCPYNCVFCFCSLGKRWRARSAENVVREIKWQAEKFGVRELCIFDDNFTFDIERAGRIAELIVEQGIEVKLQFTNGVRVDRLTREVLAKLKRAGLWLIGIAPESGNAPSLVRMKKGFTLEQVERVTRWSKELGLFTHSYFMVGFPWEKVADIESTIRYALKLDTDVTQFTRVIPFPGTELFQMLNLKPENEGEVDKGLYYGGLYYEASGISDREIRRLIKKAYRRFFLRPKRIWKLMRTLAPRDFLALIRYGIATGSV